MAGTHIYNKKISQGHWSMCSLFIILIFLISIGCQNVERPEKPENFLDEDQMFVILYDMAVVKSGRDYNLQDLVKKGITPSEYIYQKNQLDSATFKANSAWYAANPKVLKQIFEKVKDSIKNQKLLLERQMNYRDSIELVKDSIAVKPTDTIKTDRQEGVNLKNILKERKNNDAVNMNPPPVKGGKN